MTNYARAEVSYLREPEPVMGPECLCGDFEVEHIDRVGHCCWHGCTCPEFRTEEDYEPIDEEPRWAVPVVLAALTLEVAAVVVILWWATR